MLSVIIVTLSYNYSLTPLYTIERQNYYTLVINAIPVWLMLNVYVYMYSYHVRYLLKTTWTLVILCNGYITTHRPCLMTYTYKLHIKYSSQSNINAEQIISVVDRYSNGGSFTFVQIASLGNAARKCQLHYLFPRRQRNPPVAVL